MAKTLNSVRRFIKPDYNIVLSKLRKERGITQTELAKILGVRPHTISQYEGKHRVPSIITLRKITDYFQVDSDYFYRR